MSQKGFEIEIDGVLRNAEAIQNVELDGKDYLIYSVDLDDDTAEVYASLVENNPDGTQSLKDIEDDEVRKNIFRIADVILAEGE